MLIPRVWAKASGECRTRDDREMAVSVWGFGADEATAQREAKGRLERLLDRVRRGDPFPDAYAYGSRPLREEILETYGDGEPNAIVTRNRYGAQVLNTVRLLFLDIDIPAPSFMDRLSGIFGSRRSSPGDAATSKLRDDLEQYGRATFRLYRTASGLRAIAVDRDFDPAGRDTQDLMEATGTDPAFRRLCLAQKSFRARLTPKPWRCHCFVPPNEYPREDRDARRAFDRWLEEYERESRAFATCRYLETVGSGRGQGEAERLIRLHDRMTRASEALPLA